MARTDVIFSWFCNQEFGKVESQFQRPVKHISMPIPEGQHYQTQFMSKDFGWPHPLRTWIQRSGLSLDQVGRIAVMGFSQGCQGVRMALASQDAGYIEHAFAFDGIHGSWTGSGQPNKAHDNIAPDSLGPWIAYADLASRGPVAVGSAPPARRHCTIIHTSIVPPGYPSTTDTATAILNKLFGSGWPKPEFENNACDLSLYHQPPIKITPGLTGKPIEYTQSANKYYAGQRGLIVAGYYNMDPSGAADHIYAGNVMAHHALECLLIPRWNRIDPDLPSCGAPVGVSGPACNSEATLLISGTAEDASLKWSKYYDPEYKPEQEITTGVKVAGLAVGVTAGAAGTYAGWKLYHWLRERKLRTV